MRYAVISFVSLTFVTCCVLAGLGWGGQTAGQSPALSAEAMPSKQTFTPFPTDPLAAASAEDILISAAKARTAPELTKGEWINSDALTLAGLKGKVVYIEFWTFGCYNCINTLPAVKGYDKKFRDKGSWPCRCQCPTRRPLSRPRRSWRGWPGSMCCCARFADKAVCTLQRYTRARGAFQRPLARCCQSAGVCGAL